MKGMVFCLEEPSAREMLQGILPRLVPEEIRIHFIVFQGKQDLEKQLVKRLRGWLTPDTQFIVMRDQDAGDCSAVKSKLVGLCRAAGRPGALVRVACHELESFFLGDLEAVETGLCLTGLASRQRSRKFRDPDRLANPAQELQRLTKGKYQKKSGSRAIGRHLCLTENRSRSFSVLIAGIKDLVDSREQ